VKNPTPRIIALLAAALSAIFIVIVEVFFLQRNLVTQQWIKDLILFTTAFLACYIIFKSFLEIFIYRKIKLIYKTISTAKNSKEKALEKVNLSQDIISNVGKEVMEWDQTRSDEIAELRRMENFRKEFLGNVSHELKTPLFNIQGYIHTLLEGALDDPEVNVNYLQRASRSVDRLCLIVDDLEAISKLESGELILDQRTFDIHELVNEVFESIELKAKEMEIGTAFKEGSDRPFYVIGDKDRIRQVLVNLLINSIKYGKKNGLSVVGFYDMDTNVLIEITDNGIGIDPKHLPRIFERFFRVDKSRSRDQGGTGLGLAIVKHIIEAHHQTINVRSTPGIGTTFTFTLKKAR
jgi:two-component system phosphate regulon sensor histidine kinase PhoR